MLHGVIVHWLALANFAVRLFCLHLMSKKLLKKPIKCHGCRLMAVAYFIGYHLILVPSDNHCSDMFLCWLNLSGKSNLLHVVSVIGTCCLELAYTQNPFTDILKSRLKHYLFHLADISRQ